MFFSQVTFIGHMPNMSSEMLFPPFKSCDQSSAIASCICISQYSRLIWYWNFNSCTNLVYFIHLCSFVGVQHCWSLCSWCFVL